MPARFSCCSLPSSSKILTAWSSLGVTTRSRGDCWQAAKCLSCRFVVVLLFRTHQWIPTSTQHSLQKLGLKRQFWRDTKSNSHIGPFWPSLLHIAVLGMKWPITSSPCCHCCHFWCKLPATLNDIECQSQAEVRDIMRYRIDAGLAALQKMGIPKIFIPGWRNEQAE